MSGEGSPRIGRPGQLEVHVEQEQDETTLRLGGALDLSTGPVLRTASLTVLAGRPSRLTVDLADAGFLDSSGIAALLDVADAARLAGVPLVVRCASNGAARRTIEQTGTQHLLGLE